MLKNIAAAFVLPGLKIDAINTTDTNIILRARSPRICARCPRCQQVCRRVHQRHRRTLKHGRLNDTLIMIKLSVRRFHCPQCARPFREELPGIDNKQSTQRYRRHVLAEAAEHSLAGTAQHNDIGASTVSRQVDHVRYEIPWQQQGHRFSLGIDEHAWRKHQMVTTVTNLTKKKLVTILLDDRKATVINFLKQIPKGARERLEEICIDLRSSFRYAIEETLPDVKIVADPFHVVQLTGRAMEEARGVVLSNLGKPVRVKKLLRKPRERLTQEEKQKLQELWRLTRPFPSLKVAWVVKEKIRDLYRSRNRASAEKKFTLILSYLEGTESRYLTALRGTLVRWQPCILNHFDYGTNNGFTEGVHTKVKLLKRLSFGFANKQRYRKKILLGFVPLADLKLVAT